MNVVTHTSTEALHTFGFPEKAIYFSHLAHCSFCPSLLLHNGFNFLAKRLDVLRICRKVQERISETLEI